MSDDARLKEITEGFAERKLLLQKDSKEAREKIEAKIKDKEQAALAVSEIELDLRKKETALAEEERVTVEKTTQLFDNLVSLVKSLKPLSLLSEEEYDGLAGYGAEGFLEARMGAEAVLSAMEKIDVEKLAVSLRKEIDETKSTGSKFIKLAKRLKIIEGLKRAKLSPTWMIIKVLPVFLPIFVLWFNFPVEDLLHVI